MTGQQRIAFQICSRQILRAHIQIPKSPRVHRYMLCVDTSALIMVWRWGEGRGRGKGERGKQKEWGKMKREGEEEVGRRKGG